jgi:hypothetical protein
LDFGIECTWDIHLTKRIRKNQKDTPWANIDDVLPSVLGSITRMKNSRPKDIDNVWRAVVDPKYSKYTRVEKVDDDTLYIKVLSGALFSELAMIGTDDIIARIQRQGNFPGIKRLIYRR